MKAGPDTTVTARTIGSPPPAGWRIKIGFAIFIASLAWPLLLPVMPWLGFSGSTIAAFSASMLVAAEVLMLVGAAVAGKDGFAFIKAKVFGVLKSFAPPQKVSRARYRLGLVMLSVPLAFAWLSPYVGRYLPVLTERQLVLAIAGDALLVTSLFVLGGDFWDKLRALFTHRAYAVIPDDGAQR
jgi:hypothetical protein